MFLNALQAPDREEVRSEENKLTSWLSGRDLSFAALQYQVHGSVTNSMILVIVLRTVVIAEYFWVENW